MKKPAYAGRIHKFLVSLVGRYCVLIPIARYFYFTLRVLGSQLLNWLIWFFLIRSVKNNLESS